METGIPLASGFHPPAGGWSAGPVTWLPLARVEQQANALGAAWLVYAALSGLAGAIGLAFAHAWLGSHLGGHLGLAPWPGRMGHRIFSPPFLPFSFLRFAWIALALRIGFAAAAGVGLLQKSTWGRWVAIVAGCLALLHFPFGTAIGIWTLVVLLKAPNRAAYEAMAR